MRLFLKSYTPRSLLVSIISMLWFWASFGRLVHICIVDSTSFEPLPCQSRWVIVSHLCSYLCSSNITAVAVLLVMNVCGFTAGLLTSLHNETPPSEVSPSAVGRLEAGYEPPSESQLLADGLIEPVSLEMDAESDDELDALSEMYDPENKGDGTHRYTLLRELWSSAR